MRDQRKPQRARRQESPSESAPMADWVPAFQLLAHVSRTLGKTMAEQVIGAKIVSGEIATRMQWMPERGRGAPSVETVSPARCRELEQWYGLRRLLGERGLWIEQRTGFLFASRADAARFWPWPADDTQNVRPGRRSPRGAKPDFDWEKAVHEAAIFLLLNGVPETQEELVDHIAKWFGDHGPGDTQIKAHIAPLYRRAKSELGR